MKKVCLCMLWICYPHSEGLLPDERLSLHGYANIIKKIEAS
jgi:hypothetical protein